MRIIPQQQIATRMLDDWSASPTIRSAGGRAGGGACKAGSLRDAAAREVCQLVRNLIADRAQLLETQQAAAHKVMAVEERLRRIEGQIQRQNGTYQARKLCHPNVLS